MSYSRSYPKVPNRPLPSSKDPHFQNEARCTTFLVKMSFICMRMKNHFHLKGWALNLVLKQRPGGTRKWPIGDAEWNDLTFIMMGLPVRELEEDLGINFGSKPAEHSRQDSGKSFELTISPFLSSALGLLPTPKYPVDIHYKLQDPAVCCSVFSNWQTELPARPVRHNRIQLKFLQVVVLVRKEPNAMNTSECKKVLIWLLSLLHFW